MTADRPPAHDFEAILDERHPWPGLVPFREANSRFFFGRRLEQEELLRLIRRSITTLLFGESGLGKTSLLQAGLFPRLRENGYLPILVRLDYAADAKPLGEQVKARLDAAIADAGLDASRRIAPDETLWEYFHRRELTLVDRSGEPIIPVIAFDQFEELFTLGLNQRKPDCQLFVSELSDLMENRPPAAVKASLERSPERMAHYVFKRDDYRIVITVREDFLPALELFRASAPSLGRNRFRLTRMKGPQALLAVTEPGRGVVSEKVARRIVSLVGGRPAGDVGPQAIADIEVESFLLSLFCSELNERRLTGGLAAITPELVELSRRDILKSFYERALAEQPPAVREFIEDQLVTDSGARDSIARERADRLLAEKGVPATVIDRLIGSHLLHIEERPGGPRVELVHDVLLDIVRQDRAERSGRELRRTLARARKRYLARAGAAIGLVIVVAGSISLVTLEKNRQLADANRQLADANRQLADTNKQLADTNKQLADTNKQLIKYRDELRQTLESLMPVLGKFVERNEAQSLGDDKFIDEQVRPLMNKIIALADEMRGPGYDSRFMSAKALSLIILAKVANPDERAKYVDEAARISVELLRQGRTYDDISKGYDAFDAITQVWEGRDAPRALVSVDRSIDILQEIDSAVLDSDQRNWFVGSAILRKAGILRKASRFDEAEASLRSGVQRLGGAQKALPLGVLVDLYNNLGEVLLSARDRTTDEAVKRRAIGAALVEFENAWTKVVAYFQLSDSISTRNWMARHARKVAGLYEDIRNVEPARRFYGYQLRVRESLVPDESKLTTGYDVDGAKRDVASALRDIGYLERIQGDKAKSLEYYSRCVDSMRALVGKSPTDPNNESLGSCYVGLAKSLLADRKRTEALANYRHALTIREALADAQPNNAGRQSDVAYVYADLAGALLTDGKRAEALANCLKALPIRQKLAAGEPSNADRQGYLAYIYNVCADVLLAEGERAEAIENYSQALAIRDRLAAAEPTSVDRQSDLDYAYRKRADALVADGRRVEALADYQNAIDIAEAVAVAEPDRSDRQGDLASAYEAMADAVQGDGETVAFEYRDKALGARERAAALAERAETAANGKSGAATAAELGGVAWISLFVRDFRKALAASDRAIALAPNLLWLQTNRAHALMFLGHADDARSLYFRYLGAKDVQGGRPWEAVVLEDFAALRKAGLSDPLMDDIEKRLTASQ